MEETKVSRLDGKAALISGAARGIGGETAKRMAAAGAKLIVGDVLDEVGKQPSPRSRPPAAKPSTCIST